MHCPLCGLAINTDCCIFTIAVESTIQYTALFGSKVAALQTYRQSRLHRHRINHHIPNNVILGPGMVMQNRHFEHPEQTV